MELKLKAVPEKRGVYRTKIKGKDVVMAFFERNRGKAEAKFNSITIRTSALAGARTLATAEKAECYVGVSVSVAGRFADSWAITPELFRKHKIGSTEAGDFNLSETARTAYEADSDTLHGFRVEIESAPAPAPAPKPAKKQASKPTTAK